MYRLKLFTSLSLCYMSWRRRGRQMFAGYIIFAIFACLGEKLGTSILLRSVCFNLCLLPFVSREKGWKADSRCFLYLWEGSERRSWHLALSLRAHGKSWKRYLVVIYGIPAVFLCRHHRSLQIIEGRPQARPPNGTKRTTLCLTVPEAATGCWRLNCVRTRGGTRRYHIPPWGGAAGRTTICYSK